MLDPGKVSVSLVSYARPWNLPIICRSLLDYGFQDIHILDNWQNDNLLKAVFDTELRRKIHLVHAKYNCRTAGRYARFTDMQNAVIATVDDDYCVQHEGWDELLTRWDNEQIVALVPEDGMQLANSRKVPFLNIGYGSLFRAEWVRASHGFLTAEGLITNNEWDTFADRIFTTFFGNWQTALADERTLQKLTNYNGKLSETDGSAIHLQEGYWEKQWALVAKVMVMRFKARSLWMKSCPSFSAYQDQTGFLSRTGCGDSLLENGCW